METWLIVLWCVMAFLLGVGFLGIFVAAKNAHIREVYDDLMFSLEKLCAARKKGLISGTAFYEAIRKLCDAKSE